MSRRIEFGPGEVFMVADRTILVDERESVLAELSKIGVSDDQQVGYLFTFTGRVNNTDEVSSVTVAMSPQDALALTEDILNGLELLSKAQRGEQP
jgi:hypothetical protein